MVTHMRTQGPGAIPSQAYCERIPLPSFAVAERNLPDKLAGRSVCYVIDDADFPVLSEIARNVLGFAASMAEIRVVSWSDWLKGGYAGKSDILLLSSPRDLACMHPEFGRCLAEFRKANPGAFVIMNNLYCPGAEQTMLLAEFRALSLIDHIEQGYCYFPLMLHYAADRLSGGEVPAAKAKV